MNFKRLAIVAFMALALSFFQWWAAAQPPVSVKLTEVSMGKISAEAAEALAQGTLLLATDDSLEHYAYASGNRAFLSGAVQEPDGNKLNNRATGGPVYSNDGKHSAFWQVRGRDAFMVVDGKPGPEFRGRATSDPLLAPPIGEARFSKNGEHFAYVGVRDGKNWVVIDGAEGKPYDAVTAPGFDSAGTTSAYGARMGSKWKVVVNGVEQSEYDELGCPAFSPTGKLAYQAKRGNRWFIVLDGKESSAYSWVTAPRFSGEGSHVAYLASSNAQTPPTRALLARLGNTTLKTSRLWWGDKFVAVVDGAERELNGPPHPFFFDVNSNGNLLYTYLLSDQNKAVALDGRKIAEIGEGWGRPSFSPDGKRIVISTQPKKNVGTINVDGAAQKAYRYASTPSFSAGGEHIAYFALDKNAVLVVDGTEIGVSYSNVWGPRIVEEDCVLGFYSTLTPLRFVSAHEAVGLGLRGRELVRLRLEFPQ